MILVLCTWLTQPAPSWHQPWAICWNLKYVWLTVRNPASKSWLDSDHSNRETSAVAWMIGVPSPLCDTHETQIITWCACPTICSCWSETSDILCNRISFYNFMNPSIAPLCKRGNSFIFTFRKALDGVFYASAQVVAAVNVDTDCCYCWE